MYKKRDGRQCDKVPSDLFFPTTSNMYLTNALAFDSRDNASVGVDAGSEIDFVILQYIYSVICINNLNTIIEEIDENREYTIYINDAARNLFGVNYNKNQRQHLMKQMLLFHNTFVSLKNDSFITSQFPLVVIEGVVKNNLTDDGYITFKSYILSCMYKDTRLEGINRASILFDEYNKKYTSDISHQNLISARLPSNDTSFFIAEIARILAQSGRNRVANIKASTLIESNVLLKEHIDKNEDNKRMVVYRAFANLEKYIKKYIKSSSYDVEVTLKFKNKETHRKNGKLQVPSLKTSDEYTYYFKKIDKNTS